MNLEKDEIINLLTDEKQQQNLFLRADKVRKKFVGDAVHLRGLIEFSNICHNSCLYCGIRKNNQNIQRYCMNAQEIIVTAKKASDVGFKTIVLQSGENNCHTTKTLCEIIEKIKSFNMAVTLSIGEKSYNEYKAYKDAGADRYLLRIETTDKDLYHKLDPQMSWDNRYRCLMNIKELGYELGSGIMVGLPNQSISSIANDLIFLQNIGVDMAGIGPFIPHKETPLANEKGGTFELSLRTMAIMRILLEDINIPATTAMEALHTNGQLLALQSGANVIMPNITDTTYAKYYELYPNKPHSEDLMKNCYNSVSEKIISIGRTIGIDFGGHTKKIRTIH